MPVVNRIAEILDDVTAWRRDLHAHPELLYDLPRTSAFVAEKLRSFGCDSVVEGIGRTGVVGVLEGRSPGPTIGLRADMDALPMSEITGLPHASRHPGLMHACGHDGHTAMLLGAARLLAESRNFAGRVVFIFQPAEEGGAGAKAMLDDGLMDRFGVDEVYGLHNKPGIPLGRFAIRPGSIMAAADRIVIDIEGLGSHAAYPHGGVDPVLVGSHIVLALQSLVSRNVDPLTSAVVSITQFHAGSADNVIAQTGQLRGTVRTLDRGVRGMIETRLPAIVEATAAAFGAKARATYLHGYPVTVNHADQTRTAVAAAADVGGEGAVDADTAPMMGAEDFSYMLESRPGAFIFMGNGDTAGLHNPAYDFDDRAIAYGTSYWVRLVERGIAA
jgi:hippurate hydrolase